MTDLPVSIDDQSSRPVDLGDEASVKQRNKDIRTDNVLRKEIFKAVMGVPQGRQLMYWILSELCRVNHTPFAQNALVMAHTVGEQNVGLRLQAELTNPELFDLYVQMLREGTAKDERRSDKR